LPPELQKRVHEEVELAARRSDWPAWKTLALLGIARSSYYRWLREEAWAQERPKEVSPVQVFEALVTEKEAVKRYALAHAELRHRELAWRMVDEDVAYLSPSTVYRILREARLVCPWRRRSKRRRREEEKATRPNERWSSDVMYLQIGGRTYFYVSFMDEYSRYITHHELMTDMSGISISLAAQAAVDTLPKGPDGKPGASPDIRTDNGSGYISREFREVLKENELTHQTIRPHCPEENGLIERSNRTIREALDGEELTDRLAAERILERIIRRYNEERLHSALGYLRPVDYYRSNPAPLFEARRQKLVQARHRRKETNLRMKQQMLPF
jgi:putative transposase